MGLFKDDLEHPGQTVTFNCLNPSTMTSTNVEQGMKQVMAENLVGYHMNAAADNQLMNQHESDAHGVSNPMYESLKNAIVANPGP